MSSQGHRVEGRLKVNIGSDLQVWVTGHDWAPAPARTQVSPGHLELELGGLAELSCGLQNPDQEGDRFYLFNFSFAFAVGINHP